MMYEQLNRLQQHALRIKLIRFYITMGEDHILKNLATRCTLHYRSDRWH